MSILKQFYLAKLFKFCPKNCTSFWKFCLVFFEIFFLIQLLDGHNHDQKANENEVSCQYHTFDCSLDMFCLWSSYIWIIWQWQDYYDWYWKWGKFFLYLLYFFSFSLQIAQMWLATTHSFTFSNHKLQLNVLIIGVIIIIIILVMIICICCCFKSGRKCLKYIISCFCGYAIGNYLSEKLFWTFIIAYNFFYKSKTWNT